MILRGSSGSGSQSQHNVSEMIQLLESTNISVADQTTVLVRDSLASNSDPWLLNGLIDHYIVSGNNAIRKLLTGIRQQHHKNFLVKLDEYLQKPSTRYAALNLLGHIARKEPSWLSYVMQSRAFVTVIKCLQLDNDIAALTIAMYVMSTLIPKVPTAVAPHLNHIFGVFIRLVSWTTIRLVDVSDMNLHNFQMALRCLFFCLYGMYPCHFIECLQSYYCKRKTPENRVNPLPPLKYATSPGEEQVLMEQKRHEIFRIAITPLLRLVCFNSNMIAYSKELEISSEKWRKLETHDIFVGIAQNLIEVAENTTGNAAVNILRSRSPNVQKDHAFLNIKEDFDEAFPTDVGSPTAVPEEPMWSPSMMIGLSTPPSSRGISPTIEFDESKSRSNSGDKTKGKLRPETLLIPKNLTKLGNSTPSTPTGVSSDVEKLDDMNKSFPSVSTPKDFATELSWPVSAQNNFSFSADPNKESPSAKPHQFTDQPQGLQTQNQSFSQENLRNIVSTDVFFLEKGNLTLKDVLGLTQENVTSIESRDVLEREMQLAIDAGERKFTSDINWQHFGQGPLSEKDSKSLLSGYLQMHCALLFEKHHRKQHATKARRLMRNIYESSSLTQRNETLSKILSEKDCEIARLQTLLDNTRSERVDLERKHRNSMDALKHELSRTSVFLKSTLEENEKLRKQKELDNEATKKLVDINRQLNSDLSKNKLLLEYETRNKQTCVELRAQIDKLHKQLLIASEFEHKVENLERKNETFRLSEKAELEMMLKSIKSENSQLRKEHLSISQKYHLASARVVDMEMVIETKTRNIEELKKYLENVKSLARSQIQTIASKYAAHKSIATQLEIQIWDLYAQLSALKYESEIDVTDGKPIIKPLQSRYGDVLHPELSPPLETAILHRKTVATADLEASAEPNKY